MNKMLVLSRKKKEIAVITLPDGTRCEVVVVEIRGDKVRLGFQFPREVSVHRAEVQHDIDKEVSLKRILEQRRPVEKSPGYEPVRVDVPADASAKPSQVNLIPNAEVD